MENILLYLASSSPQRQNLLQQLRIPFSVLKINVEEKHQANEKAADYVRRLSLEKALAGVAVSPSDLPVLGADTIVVCDQQIMEKPQDYADAFKMLKKLSAREHQVMTAITFANNEHSLTQLVTTQVWFKPMDDQEILNYWQTGEPRDKAGSYAIQGVGGSFVTRIEGSYYSVVGLPLFETNALFTEFQKLSEKL